MSERIRLVPHDEGLELLRNFYDSVLVVDADGNEVKDDPAVDPFAPYGDEDDDEGDRPTGGTVIPFRPGQG